MLRILGLWSTHQLTGGFITLSKPYRIIRSSAPGRIVLFGEHQDYFNLPVISAGVNLRMTVIGHFHDKPYIHLVLNNMKRTYTIPLQFPIPYRFRRAYLQSAINVFYRKGFNFEGFTASFSGNIPQNAGLSSSSALTVSWTAFLSRLLGKKLKPEEIAELAFETEVLEFNEPGGRQDVYATALGNVNFLEFPSTGLPLMTPLDVSKLNDIAFVVGNSQVKKRTLNTVYRIKQKVLSNMQNLNIKSLEGLETSDISNQANHKMLKAVLNIKDITLQGRNLFSDTTVDGPTLGKFLTKQHTILRDDLHLSIDRIESMIDGAMSNGAYGCKINGSGEGGCILAICSPDKVEDVMAGISKGKGKPYHVKLDTGVKVNVFGSKEALQESNQSVNFIE